MSEYSTPEVAQKVTRAPATLAKSSFEQPPTSSSTAARNSGYFTTSSGHGHAPLTMITTVAQHISSSRLKRRADEALDDEQRFTKRFHLLDLNALRPPPPHRLPVDASPTLTPVRQHKAASSKLHVPDSSSCSIGVAEAMSIDDTPHRVYIHDLDAELASETTGNPLDTGADRLVFLPDVERRLAGIPAHILRGGTKHDGTDDEGTRDKQLVLYADAAGGITGADPHDVVRRAILDTKRRAAEEMMRRQTVDEVTVETAHGFGVREYVDAESSVHDRAAMGGIHDRVEDKDAMDIS